MQFFTRLRNTADLIIAALFTQESPAETTCQTLSETCLTLPRFLAAYAQKNSLSTSGEQAALHNHTFEYLLPSTWPVAAPFILFRLKRSGYSNCRVVAREGGLLVTADR